MFWETRHSKKLDMGGEKRKRRRPSVKSVRENERKRQPD